MPADIQDLAREKHRLWQSDPFHRSLEFKSVGADLWSVRINRSYRALGHRQGDLVVWFWIGPHGGYDRRIS